MSGHIATQFPRLCAILDAEFLSRANISPETFAGELYAAGVRWMQYRDKTAGAAAILSRVRGLRQSLPSALSLFVNDRADVCVLGNCDGLHIGQNDVSPPGARRVIGQDRLLGISTHSQEEIRIADQTDANYIAVGPIFGTTSKANPDPVVGLEGIRLSRSLTTKPLIAIGGITRRNARSAIDAGADAIAVISDLIPSSVGESPSKVAEDFLTLLL